MSDALVHPPAAYAICSQLDLATFSLTSFMSSESEQLTWQGQGLPGDNLSTQNALAILHGVMTPLVIDPSSQVGMCQAGGGVLMSCKCEYGGGAS